MVAFSGLPERVRSMEGLGVSRGMPDKFATVRSTVAVFEPRRGVALIRRFI